MVNEYQCSKLNERRSYKYSSLMTILCLLAQQHVINDQIFIVLSRLSIKSQYRLRLPFFTCQLQM